MPTDAQLLVLLRKLQKRVPRFHGVQFDEQRGQWRASIRYNQKPLIIGFYADEITAFRAYRAGKALRPQRVDAFESPAKIEKLLRLAESCPPPIRQDFSPMGSTLDQRTWRDHYEVRGHRFKGDE